MPVFTGICFTDGSEDDPSQLLCGSAQILQEVHALNWSANFVQRSLWSFNDRFLARILFIKIYQFCFNNSSSFRPAKVRFYSSRLFSFMRSLVSKTMEIIHAIVHLYKPFFFNSRAGLVIPTDLGRTLVRVTLSNKKSDTCALTISTVFYWGQ